MKKFLQTFFFLLLTTSAACAPRNIPSLTDASDKYRPVRIASGIATKPGIMSWSPDGKQLTYIDTNLRIYDVASGERKTIEIENPIYVAWSGGNSLYALSLDKEGKKVLCLIDSETLKKTELRLNMEVDALFPTSDDKKLLLLSINIRVLSMGTEVTNNVFAYDLVREKTRTLYTSSRIYLSKEINKNALLAWLHAGLNPLDDSLLIIEHIMPPVVAPYSRVSAIDPVTGDFSEIAGQQKSKIYFSASFSPDGRRIALTDSTGRLEIRRLGAQRTDLVQTLPGYYPSWNPKGSGIYAGGSVLTTDGKDQVMLYQNGADSLAQWSPDGTRLAVAAGGKLTLFDCGTPEFISPDRPLDRDLSKKLSTLRELFREGLITGQEYRERKTGLMK